MTDQTNLPPDFHKGLLALESFLSAHPGLAVGIESVRVEDGQAIATWGWRNTYQEQQAVALAHRGLVWRRQRRNQAFFDWYTKMDGVTLVLPRCEPVMLSYEISIVDLDKLPVMTISSTAEVVEA